MNGTKIYLENVIGKEVSLTYSVRGLQFTSIREYRFPNVELFLILKVVLSLVESKRFEYNNKKPKIISSYPGRYEHHSFCHILAQSITIRYETASHFPFRGMFLFGAPRFCLLFL